MTKLCKINPVSLGDKETIIMQSKDHQTNFKITIYITLDQSDI